MEERQRRAWAHWSIESLAWEIAYLREQGEDERRVQTLARVLADRIGGTAKQAIEFACEENA